jgi:hypothetical protein
MKMTKTSKINYTTPTYDALVALVHSLRPSWDEPGIRAAIRASLVLQPMPTLADLAYALVRIAIDPTITNPGVLSLPGPHWQTTTRQHTAPQPPKRCAKCSRFHGPDGPCTGHWTEADQQASIVAAQHAIATARAALGATRANLCPHGVGWRDCHQHNGHVIAGQVIHEETE